MAARPHDGTSESLETSCMIRESTTLKDACESNLLHTKWLIAPSYRVGHQWVEKLVRSGHDVVNLHPTTVLRLALEMVGNDLAKNGLALASRSVGSLVVDANWHHLDPGGYLGRLDQSAELSMAVFDSLLALRLAGCRRGQIEKAHLESGAKAEDIELLLTAYESFLDTHRLVDAADVLLQAVAKLEADPKAQRDDTLVLVPTDVHLAGLERRFVEAWPEATRIDVRHPAEQTEPAS